MDEEERKRYKSAEEMTLAAADAWKEMSKAKRAPFIEVEGWAGSNGIGLVSHHASRLMRENSVNMRKH